MPGPGASVPLDARPRGPGLRYSSDPFSRPPPPPHADAHRTPWLRPAGLLAASQVVLAGATPSGSSSPSASRLRTLPWRASLPARCGAQNPCLRFRCGMRLGTAGRRTASTAPAPPERTARISLCLQAVLAEWEQALFPLRRSVGSQRPLQMRMAADNIAEPTIRCGSARITAPRASRGLCHSRTRGLAGGMRESEGGGERAQRAQRRIAAAGGCMAVNEWCGSDSLPTRRGTHWRERDVLCRTTLSACTTGRRSRG